MASASARINSECITKSGVNRNVMYLFQDYPWLLVISLSAVPILRVLHYWVLVVSPIICCTARSKRPLGNLLLMKQAKVCPVKVPTELGNGQVGAKGLTKSSAQGQDYFTLRHWWTSNKNEASFFSFIQLILNFPCVYKRYGWKNSNVTSSSSIQLSLPVRI